MKSTICRPALVPATSCVSAIRTLPGAVWGRALRGGRERGDVPGWVMITLMTAVLVMGLLAVAGPALEGLFSQAIGRVSR